MMDVDNMSELSKIRYILLTLSAPLKTEQIEDLRGAVIRQVGGNSLYHSHSGDGHVYRYPLVQYKRIGGQAAVLIICEAVDTVSMLIGGGYATLRLGNEILPYEVIGVRSGNTLIQVCDNSFAYHLQRWLPLNKYNYEKYRSMPRLIDRVALLERVLIGNILSMCKGLGLTIDSQIKCFITQLSNPHKANYKGVDLLEFGVEFECNVFIPDYFGLGKGVTLGHGVCARKWTTNINDSEQTDIKESEQ